MGRDFVTQGVTVIFDGRNSYRLFFEGTFSEFHEVSQFENPLVSLLCRDSSLSNLYAQYMHFNEIVNIINLYLAMYVIEP